MKYGMQCSRGKRSTFTSTLSLQQIFCALFGEKKCVYLPQNFMEMKFTHVAVGEWQCLTPCWLSSPPSPVQRCCSHSNIEALTPWLLWSWCCLFAGCFLKGIIHKMGQKLWNVSRRNKAAYSRLTVARKGSEKMETTKTCSSPPLYQ